MGDIYNHSWGGIDAKGRAALGGRAVADTDGEERETYSESGLACCRSPQLSHFSQTVPTPDSSQSAPDHGRLSGGREKQEVLCPGRLTPELGKLQRHAQPRHTYADICIVQCAHPEVYLPQTHTQDCVLYEESHRLLLPKLWESSSLRGAHLTKQLHHG